MSGEVGDVGSDVDDGSTRPDEFIADIGMWDSIASRSGFRGCYPCLHTFGLYGRAVGEERWWSVKGAELTFPGKSLDPLGSGILIVSIPGFVVLVTVYC